MAHSPTERPLIRVPAIIRFPGPIINRLLGFGMRIGPNWLLTVRGRKSGELRTQPLAVVELNGSKYVIGTFGEVNWCRNLQEQIRMPRSVAATDTSRCVRSS